MPRRPRATRHRLLAALLAVCTAAAACVGAAVVLTGAASAAVLGTIAVSYPGKPSPGGDQTLFNGLLENAQCPTTTTDSFFTIVGPDLPFPDGFLGQGPVNGRGRVEFTGASIANTKTANAGSFSQPGSADYTIRFDCIAQDGSTSDMYTATLRYTNPAKTWVIVPSGPTATTTTLTASPASPSLRGTSVTLTADVDPDTVTGKVEFYDGATKLGEDTTLSGTGGAAYSTSALMEGDHSLTAKFVPTGSTFSGSTSSPLAYRVRYAAAPGWRPYLSGGTGLPGKVGYYNYCLAAFSNVKDLTYQWYVGGAPVAGATKQAFLVPEDKVGQTLACEAIASNPDYPVVRATSAAVTITPGTFRVTRAPYRTGAAQVGATSYCYHGTTTPAGTSFVYQWKRNSTVVRSTTSTAAYNAYVPTTADRGQLLTCTVIQTRTGYTAYVASTPSARVA